MNLRTEKKEKIEYVLFVLDKSGSMNSIRKETLSGLNEQIQELKKTASKITTKVSLVTFDSQVKFVRWNEPLEDFAEISEDEYIPNGMTAMLDGVGMSIDKLRNEVNIDNNDISFLVIIISDGDENSSKEYGWEKVAEIVKKAEDDNRWTITYMGANQDLSEVQQKMGLGHDNVAVWTTSTNGTGYAYSVMSGCISNYRTSRATSDATVLCKSSFYAPSVTDDITGTSTTSVE
jgi:uncharacterized protein YegL